MKKAKTRKRLKHQSELISKAVKYPGVYEAMAIYEHWASLQRALNPHFVLLRPHRVVALNNHSGTNELV